MELSYDPKYNIAYLRLAEPAGEVTTLKISDELNIDISPDGTVYGIEFLNANKQLAANADVIKFVNQVTGQCAKLKLTA